MYPLIDLRQKTILVIGASRGIGKQTAITLSEVGAKCIIASRNEDKLKDVLPLLEGDKHDYFTIDVSDVACIEPAIDKIVQNNGPLDGVIYAAGISNDRPLKFLKNDIVDSTLKTNLEGFIETIRCVSRNKSYNKGMRIVGISSNAAFVGAKANTIYAASKAGMNAAVKCLSKELASKGIAVNTIAPAMINTEMYEKWYQSNGEDSFQFKKLNAYQYLGVGDVVDVADAIAFLISPAAKFITGSCLIVDGGSTTS